LYGPGLVTGGLTAADVLIFFCTPVDYPIASGQKETKRYFLFLYRTIFKLLYFLCLEAKKVTKKIQGQFDAEHSFITNFPMANWPGRTSNQIENL